MCAVFRPLIKKREEKGKEKCWREIEAEMVAHPFREYTMPNGSPMLDSSTKTSSLLTVRFSVLLLFL